MIKTRIKIFVSNKGPLLEDKVNKELETLEQEGYFIRSIETDISFCGEKGYQSMATIIYEEYIEDDLDFDGTIGLFDTGKPMYSVEVNKA